MRIVTLMENTQGREDCLFEHGLSIYIETKDKKILDLPLYRGYSFWDFEEVYGQSSGVPS